MIDRSMSYLADHKRNAGFALAALVLVAQACVERASGRLWICKCGFIKLWEGEVHSSGNSQHIADWYTPSHIIHGFLFYCFFTLIFRKLPVGWRFLMAVVLEAAWEILENSPIIIDRYRSATIAYDYVGDSILNSVFDTIWMSIGFLLASRVPVWVTIALAAFAEIATAIIIRDNLTLNVIMLLYPLDAIKAWQAAL